MLDDLGIVDRFLADGRTPSGMRLYGNGHLLLTVALGSGVEGTAYPKPLVLPQSETERLLTEHLREVGVPVERPVELVRFAERGEGVDATLRRADGFEEDMRCDYLLGCDGAHSAVRHGLGLEFTGKAEPNDFLLADCRMDGLPDDTISLFWHPKGPLAFFPFGDGRAGSSPTSAHARATASPATRRSRRSRPSSTNAGRAASGSPTPTGSRDSGSTSARWPTTARAAASSRATPPTSTAPRAGRG